MRRQQLITATSCLVAAWILHDARLQHARSVATTATLSSTESPQFAWCLQMLRSRFATSHTVRANTYRDGIPTTSWRLDVDLQALITAMNPPDIQIPWFAGVNRAWRQDAGMFQKENDHPGTTDVLAVVGEGTAFDEKRMSTFDNLPDNLILIIQSRRSVFNWMQPGDLEVSTLLSERRELGRGDFRGAMVRPYYVGFADGTCWLMKYETPIEELLKFCHIDTCKTYERAAVLGPYRMD